STIRYTSIATALATKSDVRSIGARSTASKPPCSSSATHRRLMPSMAAKSSVTTSTPAARSPCTVGRSSPKWKTMNVVTAKRLIPGTASSVRSSMRSSLRRSAPSTLMAPPPRAKTKVSSGRKDAVLARSSVERPDVGHADVGRRRQQLGAAAAQAEGEIGLGEPAGRVVAGDHARAPGQQRADQSACGGVEVGARLVEQQQLGVVEDRARDRHPLHRAAAEVAHGLVGPALELQALEQLGDPLLADAEQPRLEAQVLAPGRLAVEQRLVAEEADATAHRPRLAGQPAAEHAPDPA